MQSWKVRGASIPVPAPNSLLSPPPVVQRRSKEPQLEKFTKVNNLRGRNLLIPCCLERDRTVKHSSRSAQIESRSVSLRVRSLGSGQRQLKTFVVAWLTRQADSVSRSKL